MRRSGPLSQPSQKHPPSHNRSKRGPPFVRDEGEHVFGGGKSLWSFERHHAPSSKTVIFNLRLGHFVDTRQPLKLVETLKEMKELGLKPDIVTYNSAMDLFGRLDMEDEAWALVDDMKASGIMPDIETYKFLLQVRTTRPFHGGVIEMFFLTYRLFVAHPTTPLGPCSE
jgi:pentatricopeptide repeat protein